MAQLSEPARVRRLYDRLGFSIGGAELVAAQKHGFDASVTALLDRSGSDPGASADPPPALQDVPRAGKKADQDAKHEARRRLRDQQATLTLWWLDRMSRADQVANERLTWFWHGHFATSIQKVRSGRLMLQQNETFRQHALGSFADLARELIIDPAMLVWLDGNNNTAKAPNENLSREFMELFTLGHGHYSEEDVRQAARALTGWKVDRDAGKAIFRQRLHDDGRKTVLGTTADLDAEGFVALVLKQSASPAFVISRLWARLVSSAPVSPEVARAVGDAYGPDGDISAALKSMVTRPEFSETSTTLVKQPVEWLVALVRALGVRPSALEDRQRAKLLTLLRGLGQVPFRPPSVGGWPAGAGWLTTASALSRMDAARLVVAQADLSDISSASAKARPEQVRRLLGVDRFSTRTTEAIAQTGRLPDAIAVGACSPEYTVSG